MNRLENVHVVLVGTSAAGNIGASARAMKTMGLGSLRLVAPVRFPDPAATARATGATDVLDRARVFGTLEEAIGDCVLVVATSARRRRVAWPTFTPREASARLLAAAGKGPVAVMFGRERTGLLNEELVRSHCVVEIPTDEDYHSLNLAAAVQILAYELRLAGAGSATGEDLRPDAADARELRRFYEHLRAVLVAVEFLDPARSPQLMPKLMRLFNRAHPTREDLNILRGILTAVSERVAGRSMTDV